MRAWVWVLVAMALPAWAEDSEAEAEAAPTRARVLTKAYQENELSADGLYKDKALLVLGVVRQVRKEPSGVPFASLESGDPAAEVRASLAGEAIEAAQALKKGDLVAAKCTGNGVAQGNPLLRDCTVTVVKLDELKPALRFARSVELCLGKKLEALAEAGQVKDASVVMAGKKAAAKAEKDLAKAKLAPIDCANPGLTLLGQCDGAEPQTAECKFPLIAAAVAALQR